MEHLKTYKLFESISREEISNMEIDIRNILLELSDEYIQSAIGVDKRIDRMEIHLYRESEFPNPNGIFYWKDIEETINRINNYVSSSPSDWLIRFYINNRGISYIDGNWVDKDFPNSDSIFTNPINSFQIHID